jgi:hypothetical protein
VLWNERAAVETREEEKIGVYTRGREMKSGKAKGMRCG